MELTKKHLEYLDKLIQRGKNLLKSKNQDFSSKNLPFDKWLVDSATFFSSLDKDHYKRFQSAKKRGFWFHGHGSESVKVILNYFNSLKEFQQSAFQDVQIKANFSINSGFLIFGEKRVKFGKTTKQYEYSKILFKDKDSMSKDWQFSDLAEQYDKSTPPSDKQVDNIFRAIDTKIKAAIGVQDFFSLTAHSVKINPRYFES